jgi:hypothetical protein
MDLMKRTSTIYSDPFKIKTDIFLGTAVFIDKTSLLYLYLPVDDQINTHPLVDGRMRHKHLLLTL